MISFTRPTLLLSCCAILLAPAAGCSLLATSMWIMNPNDVDAEYTGLEQRRVAVVCQPSSALDLQYFGVDQELAARLSEKLRANVNEIEIVSQTEIHDWIDENQLTKANPGGRSSFREFGLAMKADLVVVIDMPEFDLYKGETMLQGEATANVTVYDVATDDVEYTLEPISTLFPPENGIPIELANQRTAERNFRRRFIEVLADQIGRRFYAHDSRQSVKTDRFY